VHPYFADREAEPAYELAQNEEHLSTLRDGSACLQAFRWTRIRIPALNRGRSA
jgi:hypothetical protein